MKRQTRLVIAMALFWVLALLSMGEANAQTAVTGRSGRITAMNCAGEYLPIETNLVVPLKGWDVQRSLSDVRRPRSVRESGKTTWSGSIPMASGKAYRFDGFGGNYCFGIESPVTQYTLDNLKVAWARTEMSLAIWEPENDNDFPDTIKWEPFRRRDTPDSRLRREWLLMKQIQDKGIPYVISAWRMPRWLTEPAGRRTESRTRRLRPEMWPEMFEAVGSYLLYAKEHYGVEPDLFSFNEANIGVDLLLTPEEHHQMIKRLGAHLKKLGLKTKMVLAISSTLASGARSSGSSPTTTASSTKRKMLRERA